MSVENKTPEQEYVDSVEEVIDLIQATGTSSSEVVMAFASIWAQAKASEITTLNVVERQMEMVGEEQA